MSTMTSRREDQYLRDMMGALHLSVTRAPPRPQGQLIANFVQGCEVPMSFSRKDPFVKAANKEWKAVKKLAKKATYQIQGDLQGDEECLRLANEYICYIKNVMKRDLRYQGNCFRMLRRFKDIMAAQGTSIESTTSKSVRSDESHASDDRYSCGVPEDAGPNFLSEEIKNYELRSPVIHDDRSTSLGYTRSEVSSDDDIQCPCPDVHGVDQERGEGPFHLEEHGHESGASNAATSVVAPSDESYARSEVSSDAAESSTGYLISSPGTAHAFFNYHTVPILSPPPVRSTYAADASPSVIHPPAPMFLTAAPPPPRYIPQRYDLDYAIRNRLPIIVPLGVYSKMRVPNT